MRDAVNLRDLLRLDGDEATLLQTAVDALPALPGELFSVANRYRLEDGRVLPGSLAKRGAQSFERLSAAFQVTAEAPPAFMGGDHALTSTTHADAWNATAARAAEISGCADFVGTVVHLGEGRFAMAGAGTAERVPAPRQDLRIYGAIHRLLAINLRVRDALGEDAALESADAVLTSSGRMVELRDPEARERDVRQRLSEIVRAREAQSGSFAPLEDTQALTHWNELTLGRYVLLDYVDSDHRRYVVAYRMRAPSPAPHGLSPRERLVLERILLGERNKTIASELGVSSAHISGISQRALSKLGVRSVADLTTVMRARSSWVLGDLQFGGESLVALGFRDASAEALSELTCAERHVAHAVLAGKRQRDIALERGVSERTIASQVASVYRKLGVSGRRELTAKFTR